MRILLRAFLAALVCATGSFAAAQAGGAPGSALVAQRTLITQLVDELQRTVLKGNTHPLARPAFDRGTAPASLPMRRMTLVLQRSAERESALRTLLDEQQTRSSASYHRWLSPEQFGKQFGPSDGDLTTVKAWLESHGFQVAGISKGRIAIEFSGTAGQVEEAFRTSIHKYEVNGELHWANNTDPSIPSALAPAVKGVLTLHNFPRHPEFTLRAAQVRKAQDTLGASPLFTFTSGPDTYYGLGPTDFATIYNVLPLWNAGIDGTGQTIAIVGETNIHISDIEAFRSLFGLPARDPVVILNGPDPGVVGDEPEAVLDVSWSGAVAKNATIDLVVSASTETSLGVDLSALYIVDNDLAPVMSESYGICEQTLGTGNAFYNALWQQAAAEGITVVVAAGDGGSAGCDDFDSEEFAFDGIAVSGFVSTPYNVAVGGTDFDQNPATEANYWSATNNATTGASAKGYIPETTWNQSCAGQVASQCTDSSNNLDIVAGSGGPSNSAVANSQGTPSGYPKPSWQTGAGVPQDGVRDVPDLSLFASSGFSGSFYIMCEEDINGFFGTPADCSLANDTFVGIGGTSAAAPSFAGMIALVNQKTSARQGNANYVLYKLAAQNGASCNSSTAAATGNSCIFYDITKGNDSVPCWGGTPDCGTAPANGYGVLVDPNNPNNPAWTTTPGYDLATGLGTVNADNLVNAWNSAAFTPSATTLTNLSPVSVAHGQAVSISATVEAKAGSGAGTPTGSIALIATPGGNNLGVDNFPLVNGVATGSTALLPGGTYNVRAHYAGDGTFGASDSAPVEVTVGKENSTSALVLEAEDQANGWQFAPVTTVPYGSLLLVRANVNGAAGVACAPSQLQSGVACPTGSVSLTSGGKPLDAGGYTLNSLGYAEDQAVALDLAALGSYTINVQYAGDNSYNTSSGSVAATVVQAPTFMYSVNPNQTNIEISGGNYIYYVFSGQPFGLGVAASTGSVFQAPSGSISILENGSPVPGTVNTSSTSGSFSGNLNAPGLAFAYISAGLTRTINTPGNYTYTASYPGDAFYLGSQTSAPVTVTVEDTTFNLTTPIPNVTISAPGQTGTAALALTGVDNFAGQVTISCTLPATMLEASCANATVNMNSPTATAQLSITTAAAHTIGLKRAPLAPFLGAGAVVCLLVFFAPCGWRRKLPIAVFLLACLAGLGGCGGAGQPPIQDNGTPAGTYTVNVTASAYGINRTGSFTVTVQ